MGGGPHRRRRGARPNLQPNPPPCSQGSTNQTAITTVTICFTYSTESHAADKEFNAVYCTPVQDSDNQTFNKCM